MGKKQFLRHSVFLILFCGLMACQDYSLDHEGIVHNLNPIGKAFMQRLKEAPDWSAGWKEVSLKGEVLPNEAALLYGGGYGWHYVLPLVEGKVIIGLVIYPIVDIGENEGPGEGRLGKPIVRVGLEIIEDVGAGSFFCTHAFIEWKNHGFKPSQKLNEARDKWGPAALNKIALRTKSANGGYLCFYSLVFQNYIDENGYAVVVGMGVSQLENVLRNLAFGMMDFRDIEVNDEYITIRDCDESKMRYLLNLAYEDLLKKHVFLTIGVIWGTDCNGHMINEYSDGDKGGCIGDFDGNGKKRPSTTPIMDQLCKKDSHLTQAEKQLIEDGINDLKQQYPLATALFDKLVNSGIQITIGFDPNMPKGSIKYNMSTHTLTFLNADVLSTYGALEDWTHVAQCEIYYADQIISNRNLEFEAKMFCDINCAIIGEDACLSLQPGFLYNSNLLIQYIDFMNNLALGTSINGCLEDYYKFGESWNDPHYQTGIFQKKYPKLIGDLIK